MVNHVWSVLCQKSILDRDSNNISLIDVLEQLGIPSSTIPSAEGGRMVLPLNVELVTLWERADYEHPVRGRARITLHDPTGTPIGPPNEYDVDLTAHTRTRARTHLSGLPFVGAGRYLFSIEVQSEGETAWRSAASVPLQVTIQPSTIH